MTLRVGLVTCLGLSLSAGIGVGHVTSPGWGLWLLQTLSLNFCCTQSPLVTLQAAWDWDGMRI